MNGSVIHTYIFLQEFDEVVQERRNVQSDDALMEKIISNPIHAYKMMKRFAVDWQLIEKDLQTDEWSEVEFMLKVSQFLEKKTSKNKNVFVYSI